MFAVFLINTLNFNFRHCRFWLLKALVSAFYLRIVFNSSYICGLFCFGAFSKIRFGRDTFRPRSVALHSSEPSVAREKVKLFNLMVKRRRDCSLKKKNKKLAVYGTLSSSYLSNKAIVIPIPSALSPALLNI